MHNINVFLKYSRPLVLIQIFKHLIFVRTLIEINVTALQKNAGDSMRFQLISELQVTKLTSWLNTLQLCSRPCSSEITSAFHLRKGQESVTCNNPVVGSSDSYVSHSYARKTITPFFYSYFSRGKGGCYQWSLCCLATASLSFPLFDVWNGFLYHPHHFVESSVIFIHSTSLFTKSPTRG